MWSYCEYFSEIEFSFKTKYIHWPTFVSNFSAVYRVSIPGGDPRRSFLLFQASRHGQFLKIAFVRDVDIDNGTLVSREPQTRRLCKYNLNFSQGNKYHYAIGGDEEKEMLVFVCDFFSVSLQRKKHVQVHFTVASQFYVNIIFLCETESSIPRAS